MPHFDLAFIIVSFFFSVGLRTFVYYLFMLVDKAFGTRGHDYKEVNAFLANLSGIISFLIIVWPR